MQIPPEPPYGNQIHAIKEQIRAISDYILQTDWRSLGSESRNLETLMTELRSIISSVEKLERYSPDINMRPVLDALNIALRELYSASDLEKKTDARSISSRYEKFTNCRRYLNLAVSILNGEQEDAFSELTPQNTQQKSNISTFPTTQSSRKRRTTSRTIKTSSATSATPTLPSEGVIKQGVKPEDVENNAINDTAVGIKDDRLNFKFYVDALAAFIISQDTTTPLTISINGPWGMGKSSLMMMLKERLEPIESKGWDLMSRLRKLICDNVKHAKVISRTFSHNAKSQSITTMGQQPRSHETRHQTIPPPFHLTIWFNAWKFSQEEQIWAALALETLEQIKQKYRFIGRIIFWLRLNGKRFSWPTALWNIFKRVAIPLILGFLAWNYTVYITQILGPNSKNFLHQFGSIVFLGSPLLWMGALLSGILQIASIIKDPFQIPVKNILDKPNYKDKVGFIGSFETDFSRIVSVATRHFGWQAQKLIIFIDDLDRCRPLQAASIVEAISLLLDSKQCVFVIGMDPVAVSTSIEAKYKELSEKIRRETPGIVSPGSMFLDKIIQIPFNLPRPTLQDINTLIEEITRAEHGPSINSSVLLPSSNPSNPVSYLAQIDTDVGSFERDDIQNAIKCASKHLKQNPRLVKRFINLFRLKVYLADKYKLLHGQSLIPLAILVVWSMQWPEVIKLLVDEAYSSDITTFLADICEQIQEDGNWKANNNISDDQQEMISIFDQFINDFLKDRRARYEKFPSHWCYLPWEEWIRDKDFRSCLKFMEKESLWQHLKARESTQERAISGLVQLMRL